MVQGKEDNLGTELTNRTDNFIDIDLELDFEIDSTEYDTIVDLDLTEEDEEINFDLFDAYGDHSVLPTDLMEDLEHVPEKSKLIQIIENNTKYSSTNVARISKYSRNRVLRNKILEIIRNPKNNELLKDSRNVGIITSIESHLGNVESYAEQGKEYRKKLSTTLSKQGVMYENDETPEVIDRLVREYSTGLKIEIAQRNIEMEVMRNSQSTKVDLANSLPKYIDKVLFTSSTGKMVVTCPTCRKEIEHKIVESYRPIADLKDKEVLYRHNPLMCECGTISILPEEDELQLDMMFKMEYSNYITELDKEDAKRKVIAIGINNFSTLGCVELENVTEVREIKDTDVRMYKIAYRSNSKARSKRFYKELLSHEGNKDLKIGMLTNGAFNHIRNKSSNPYDLVVGSIVHSPYFQIIKEIRKRYTIALPKLIEYDKLRNMLEYLTADQVANETINLDIDAVIEGINITLTSLGLNNRENNLVAKPIKKATVNKLITYSDERLSKYKGVIIKCKEDMGKVIDYLSKNSNNLFRFTGVHSCEDDTKLFKEVFTYEQGHSLINSVVEPIARGIWTEKMINKYSYILSTKSSNKFGPNENLKAIYKTIENNFSKLQGKTKGRYAYSGEDKLEKMVNLLYMLLNSMESLNYYRFKYIIMDIQNSDFVFNSSMSYVEELIDNIEITEEERTMFNQLKSINKFEQYFTLLSLEFPSEEILEFIKDNNFNCSNIRSRKGKRKVSTYVRDLNKLERYTPTKCILNLADYKELCAELMLLKRKEILITKHDNLHPKIIMQILLMTDNMIDDCSVVDLIDELNVFQEIGEFNCNYTEIEKQIDESTEIGNILMNDSRIYTRSLRESIEEGKDMRGTVDQDLFFNMIGNELSKEFMFHEEMKLFYMTKVEVSGDLLALDHLIEDGEIRRRFKKIAEVFVDSKYTERLEKDYGITKGYYNKYKSSLINYLNQMEYKIDKPVWVGFSEQLKRIITF